jgi:hypothetical protein
MIRLYDKPRSRKEPIVSQVTITLNYFHAIRWATYAARRVHAAKGNVGQIWDNWRDLHSILYDATETKRDEYTITFPEHLKPQAIQYSYVARRLP